MAVKHFAKIPDLGFGTFGWGKHAACMSAWQNCQGTIFAANEQA